jgi:hypothetical protein
MAVERRTSETLRRRAVVGTFSPWLASLACLACGAGDPDGAPNFQMAPPQSNSPGVGGTTSAPNVPANPNANGTPPTGAGGSTGSGEPVQNGGVPLSGSGGSTQTGSSGIPAGAGGTAMVGNGSAGASTLPDPNPPADPNTPPVDPNTPPANPSVPPPQPPGDAFFFDDFEGNVVGEPPPNWDYFIAYNANRDNPSGGASALVDDSQVFSGTRAVHIVGGSSPAQITFPLPAGTNRLFVKAQIYMTRQLGQNPDANHETLIAIRGNPGAVDNEVRFGEIKGVIGTNDARSDDISPPAAQWGLGPVVAPNQWHCFEVQFLGDLPENQLFAYADGELVHSVTAPDQWDHKTLSGQWMAGKFQEAVLGWQSFSNANIDVWLDDIVLSNGPIGCD